jgi:septum formation protein
LNDDEIRWYVGTGEPLDKAGAYGAQGKGGLLVERVEGSFSNVVGFPLEKFYELLKESGLSNELG